MTSSLPDDDRERISKIINRLVAQTRAGRIHWEPAGPASYVFSSMSSSVTLTCRDADDNYPYDVAIFNRNGASVAVMEYLRDTEGASEVAELYRLAGRLHLEVDQTLDNLLSELEDE